MPLFDPDANLSPGLPYISVLVVKLGNGKCKSNAVAYDAVAM